MLRSAESLKRLVVNPLRCLLVLLIISIWILAYQLYINKLDISLPYLDKGGKLKIGIVSILFDSRSSWSNYKTAVDSMKCFSLQNNYDFISINASRYAQECPHIGPTFQRHCIVANVLQKNNYDWILFTDSDIGVINEKRKLEDYIQTEADIIFYERFFNFEIMSGAYLVRKTDFAMKFLHDYADYEKRAPKDVVGIDNGALHMYLVELLAPNSNLLPRCWKLWNDTKNFETLTRYTLCCREALKTSNSSRVFIYKKGDGWARDAWLTNSYWNPEIDFMFHSLKEKDLEQFTLGTKRTLQPKRYFWSWFNTLNMQLDLNKCRKGRMEWSHVQELIAPKEELEAHLNKIRRQVEKEYQSKLHFAYGNY